MRRGVWETRPVNERRERREIVNAMAVVWFVLEDVFVD